MGAALSDWFVGGQGNDLEWWAVPAHFLFLFVTSVVDFLAWDS